VYGCMDVCMYGCMHVCTYACVDACMYACMEVCMYGCMQYAGTQVRRYVCMRVCMYADMYVYKLFTLYPLHAQRNTGLNHIHDKNTDKY
jgi:hypothetical protein